MTLDYDERRHRLVQDYISLNGTIVNCAGGIAFGADAWLTCEETTAGTPPWGQPHGYVFRVPLNAELGEVPTAEPIKPMGRFSHEALAVDQDTGVVYLTEDAGSGVGSGFYRYLPHDPTDLQAGGSLQMLGIAGQPQYDTREGQTQGLVLPVAWFEILDPDPVAAGNTSPTRTFNQGFDQGGAKFNRLEGCWWEGGSVFFVATSGGDVKNGDAPTRTDFARDTARSGSTRHRSHPADTSACSSSRRGRPSSTRPTTSRSPRAAAFCFARTMRAERTTTRTLWRRASSTRTA